MFVFVLQDGTETTFGVLPLAMRCERMGEMADPESRIVVPWDALTHGAFVHWVETEACDDDMLMPVMKAAAVIECRGLGQLLYRAMQHMTLRPVAREEGELFAELAARHGTGRKSVTTRVRFESVAYRVTAVYGHQRSVWEMMLHTDDSTLLASFGRRSNSNFTSYLEPGFISCHFEDGSRFLRAAFASLCSNEGPRFGVEVRFTFDHEEYRKGTCRYVFEMRCE